MILRCFARCFVVVGASGCRHLSRPAVVRLLSAVSAGVRVTSIALCRSRLGKPAHDPL